MKGLDNLILNGKEKMIIFRNEEVIGIIVKRNKLYSVISPGIYEIHNKFSRSLNLLRMSVEECGFSTTPSIHPLLEY